MCTLQACGRSLSRVYTRKLQGGMALCAAHVPPCGSQWGLVVVVNGTCRH